MTANILIVDDQEDIRSLVGGILEDEGYSTYQAETSQEAEKIIASAEVNMVVLDIWLEGSELDGLQLLKKLVKKYIDIPVVMISGHGSIETAVSAIQIGAYDFIEKPFESDKLLVLVKRALEAGRLRRENQELKIKNNLDASELIGNSTIMQQIKQNISRVAPTSSRVLITGDAGTGKDVAARMMHKMSKRAKENYVVLNCAILSPSSIEMELFGTENSVEIRNGVLEQANGGTLFLDEVADMPLETQTKIVRLLQDQRFTRIGGTKEIEVDVRIVSSSNQDLEELVKEGKFRQDLYYRLNVVPLRMPSLQERLEDIPVLAEYFMSHAAIASNVFPRKITDDAVAVMQNYNWPGNVRQLRNVIEWLLIMADGEADDPITVEMLPPDLRQEAVEKVSNNEGVIEMMSKPIREAREVFEKEYLLSQIKRFGGNISKTAEFVGMERSALHRKLRSLGISIHEKEKDNKIP